MRHFDLDRQIRLHTERFATKDRARALGAEYRRGEARRGCIGQPQIRRPHVDIDRTCGVYRTEEHTSELQSLMRISYAVFCLKKKKKNHATTITRDPTKK